MAQGSPLLALHETAGAVIAPYGPEGHGIPVVQVYTGIDREYAAIRKSAAILDLPQRSILAVSGQDRLSFLNRMLTQELKDLDSNGPLFRLRRSFWLNRKGRIDADLVVIAQPDEILIEVDAHAVIRAIEGLTSFIIADDVQITDRSREWHRFDIHGPAAAGVLTRVSTLGPGSPDPGSLPQFAARIYEIAGTSALAWRLDVAGESGFSVAVRSDSAAEVYRLIAETPEMIDHDRTRPDRGFDLKERAASADGRAVRIGWHAFNIARIEAGTALYNLDFGPTSLPHETGDETLHDRVSFKKGCYLGQEVVARMHSLGHPRQRLVAFDLADTTAQPITGSFIHAGADTSQPPVGAVTSSAISPMLGGRSVCFGMVKYAHSNPGAEVWIEPAPGTSLIRATVRESLRYWSRKD